MRCLDALLPTVAADFGRSVGSTGAAVTAYALGYSLCQLLYGPLGDRVGAYRVVAITACLAAAIGVACALATSLNGLVLLRLLTGCVAGAVGPLSLSWVSLAALPEDRALAFARLTGAAILGGACGQVGGGILGDNFGWRMVFLFTSALFAISGLALIIIARSMAGLTHPALCQRQRLKVPPRLLQLIRRPAVIQVLILVGCEGFGIYLSLPYITAHIADGFAQGSSSAAILLGFYGVGAITFVGVARGFLRHAGAGVRAAIAGVLLGGAFTLLALSTSTIACAAALFTVGFGFMLLHNLLQLIAAHVAPGAPGSALSLFAASSSLSQGLGAAAGGALFDRSGAQTACVVSAAMLVVASGATAFVLKRTVNAGGDAMRKALV